jgi:integrase/recombinase XerD
LFLDFASMQALELPELRAVLTAAYNARKRDWLMMLMAFSHGLRATEVVSLTADTVRDGFLRVKRLKNSLETIQPLLVHADPLLNERAAVLEFISGMSATERLFPITRQHFWRIVQRHAQAAGLPTHQRHPHMFKHTVAMQLIDTAGLETTRQYLGHRRISSTAAYLRTNDKKASAKAGAVLGAL